MTPSQHSEPLRLACRHFRPKITDVTVEFVRGIVPGEVVEVPTYAAVDPRALHIESKRLARQYGQIFLRELATSGSSEIVQRTLQEAFRHAVRPLTDLLLYLKAACLSTDDIHARRKLRGVSSTKR